MDHVKQAIKELCDICSDPNQAKDWFGKWVNYVTAEISGLEIEADKDQQGPNQYWVNKQQAAHQRLMQEVLDNYTSAEWSSQGEDHQYRIRIFVLNTRSGGK